MTTEIPITNSYTGTPFTIEDAGRQTKYQVNSYSGTGLDFTQSKAEANKLSMLNSNLEKIFKLEKGYFGKEDKYELLPAKEVRLEIASKGKLYQMLKNMMNNPGDKGYLLDEEAEKASLATCVHRTSSPDEPLILVTGKPDVAVKMVIMRCIESSDPQARAEKLLRPTNEQ